MLKAVKQWAHNRQAVEIAFGINSGVEFERSARFATRMGYAKIGENFVKGMS